MIKREDLECFRSSLKSNILHNLNSIELLKMRLRYYHADEINVWINVIPFTFYYYVVPQTFNVICIFLAVFPVLKVKVMQLQLS